MIGRRSKKLLDATIGAVAVGLLRAVKRIRREHAANFAGAFMRKVGPLVPEHRIGRNNLRSAFPEKSEPKSVRYCPASGTISAGSPRSSSISMNFASSNPEFR